MKSKRDQKLYRDSFVFEAWTLTRFASVSEWIKWIYFYLKWIYFKDFYSNEHHLEWLFSGSKFWRWLRISIKLNGAKSCCVFNIRYDLYFFMKISLNFSLVMFWKLFFIKRIFNYFIWEVIGRLRLGFFISEAVEI